MRRLGKLFFGFCVSCLILGGCAETQQYQPADELCLSNANRAKAVKAAEDILAEMNFDIAKADIEAGYITTAPLSGAKFFEFWRSDSIGTQNRLQSNLHSIRKIAELNVEQKGQQLCIRCNVKVERLSLPEHQVSSSTRAYEMFSRSTASLQQLRPRPEQQNRMAWLDLGSDEQLASQILRNIKEQMARPNSNK